jgi:hypothetical protein
MKCARLGTKLSTGGSRGVTSAHSAGGAGHSRTRLLGSSEKSFFVSVAKGLGRLTTVSSGACTLGNAWNARVKRSGCQWLGCPRQYAATTITVMQRQVLQDVGSDVTDTGYCECWISAPLGVVPVTV